MKLLGIIFFTTLLSFSLNAQTTYGVGAGTSGNWSNSYFGQDAGKINTGPFNTFLGARSGEKNTSGDYNTFTGAYTGLNNSTGRLNSFYGKGAGQWNTTGSSNVFMGYHSGYNNIDGACNTFMGVGTGQNTTSGDHNSFFGYNAGKANTTGEYNVFMGTNAGKSNTTGKRNSFYGIIAGRDNKTGSYNSFFGLGAGQFNDSGQHNTNIGVDAGNNNVIGSFNVSLGYRAGYKNTGSSNVFIGYRAGYHETGSNKLYIDNTDTSAPLLEGDFNSNELQINGDLDVTGVASKPGGGSWATLSDKRLKHSINKYEKGLKEILKVNTITYKYTKDVEQVNTDKEFVGVIAQELQKIDSSMIKEVQLSNSENKKQADYLSVDPSAFTYMLINAVKEQHNLIEEKDKAIESLNKRLTNLEEKMQNSIGFNEKLESNQLLQNQPNPFNKYTIIRYKLEGYQQDAQIQIMDMSGKLLKNIPIEQSMNGEVSINANEFSTGQYIYNLIIDGKLASTKKMILTK